MHDCITPGDLVSELTAYTYFCSFTVLGMFTMINLFVAVILENFEREFSCDATSHVCSTRRGCALLFACTIARMTHMC